MTEADVVQDNPFVDERHYLFDRRKDRPWPAGERDQLGLTVRRIWSHDPVGFHRHVGQVRSPALRVQILLFGHRQLKLPSRANLPVEDEICVVNEEATFDAVDEAVKLGTSYIQVLCSHLRRQGLGTLVFNAMIAWAHQYHGSATVRPLHVPNKDVRPFYQRFGFRFSDDYTVERPVATIQIVPVPDRITATPGRLIF